MLNPALIALMLAAGLVNGWTALGFAMIAAAGFALAVDPKTAVLLIAVTTPFISSMQLINHKSSFPGWRRLAPIAIGGCVGGALGAVLLGVLHADAIALLLGAMAVLFVVSTFANRGPRIPASAERYTSPVAGVAAGVANGTVGVSGPVLGIYLIALGLTPAAFGFTISLLFFAMGLVRLVSLGALGQLTWAIVGTGVGLVIPALIGQQIGFRLHHWVKPARARQAARVLIGVAGITLILRGLNLS
jgi:uncharacterized membrane protein YfcA